MEDKIEKLIEHLRGTCVSMYEGCADMDIDEDDLTLEELQQVDNEIFRCASCGWWYDKDECNEVNGEWVCDDCNEE